EGAALGGRSARARSAETICREEGDRLRRGRRWPAALPPTAAARSVGAARARGRSALGGEAGAQAQVGGLADSPARSLETETGLRLRDGDFWRCDQTC